MVATAVAVWDSVLSSLKSEISYSSFETWFQETRPVALNDGSLTIAVPDPFTKGGIERRYREMIEEIASRSCEHPVALIVEIRKDGPNAASSSARVNEEAIVPRNGALPLNPDYTFGSFVRGKNCDLAYFASEAVAGKPGTAYNPLFIYGAVGLGKTHLLQAIGNHVLQGSPGSSVVYTSSERFAIELINSIRNNATAAFRNKYRQIDLLLIDDVHFLEGKEATQEELFHTFNELHGNEKQIVLSSDRAPEDLSGLQERLVSRFRWGLVADIQAPDLETRIAILRILQESLLNARKHAQAQHIIVALLFEENTLRLTVKDDGRGFSPGELQARPPGAGAAGLQSMRARAQALGGEFRVQTGPDQGTNVEAIIPIA